MPHTEIMPLAKPDWVFTRAANRTWAWRAIPNKGPGEDSRSFPSLDTAAADAIKHGFDPSNEYWVTNVNRRSTHFQPGKAPVNLPSEPFTS